ncbi:hypothetical protein KAT36_02230 [Candidatus Pacearchaeota archaeon]|nr:hypothetical protein [Candidatus Pacearchaeota archaeon]
MKKLGYLVIFALMSAGVLAEISISEPSAIYNLGDRLYVSAEGLVGAEHGNLNVDLLCGNRTINLEKMSARRYGSGEVFSYSLPYKFLNREDLEIENLGEVLGECQIRLALGDSESLTKTFSISDGVVVSVSLDKVLYNPGEAVSITVEAVKANGAKLNGFVEGFDVAVFSKAIEEGFVEEIFVLPETIEAGSYYLNVSAYDVGSSGVLNHGVSGVSFDVAQVASSMIISLSGEEAVPGENFSIGVEVFDQSGVEMIGNVLLKILSSNGEVIEDSVSAGEFGNIDFVLNSSVGTWKVVAHFNEMVKEREFEMVALQKVEFDLEDSILSITNVGNVLYNKTIDVEIGSEVLILELNIGVGEVRKFDIGAPTGEYEVVVGDGENFFNKRVLLTGNAVSVKNLRTVGIFNNYFIIWFFLILILGGIGMFLFVRYRKTKTIGKPSIVGNVVRTVGRVKQNAGKEVIKKVPTCVKSHVNHSLNFTNKSPSVQGLDSKNYSHKDKTMVDLTSGTSASAESALVLKGEKLVSGIVSLVIKNYEDLSEMARANLHKIVTESKGKGLIDWRGEYVFVVFSPLVTRTYGNESLAVKCGMEIVKRLNEHNKKFKDKIEFGLGVHVGELIASKAGEKLKYTSIGNTISFAKRMSDVDSGRVIISEVVRKKLIRDLKVVKGKEIGENVTYIVKEVKDRSGDAARLKQLLARNKVS